MNTAPGRIFHATTTLPSDVNALMDSTFTVWRRTAPGGTQWRAEDGRVANIWEIRRNWTGRGLVEVL